MRCPSCGRADYALDRPCPGCAFSGDPERVQELAHVAWLLAEIEGWAAPEVDAAARESLRHRYAARREEIEVALGLRPAPFTESEARQAWPQLFERETLRFRIEDWQRAGLLSPAAAQEALDRLDGQIEDLLDRLRGHPRPETPDNDDFRLRVTEALRAAAAVLEFAGPEAAQQVRDALAEEQAAIEIRLGLRAPLPPEAADAESAPAPDRAPEIVSAPAKEPPSPPPAPKAPFRERLWRTLASERTLRALLFLGIFLLFAAAISFVVWGWQEFAPAVRVVIPSGFTLCFFALGWMVRTRMSLYRSGIALSAIASLLIPIDFYTAFVNLEFPAEAWPEFWLFASLSCLAAYLGVTLIIHNALFGYLVGAAAGSVVLAAIEIGHERAGLSRDWYAAGLAVLAAGLAVLGTWIARRARGRWQVLGAPLHDLALLATGVLMPLTLGWRFIDRPAIDTLHYALTITWWVGGFVLGWGAVQHRSRGLGLVAALALPVAVYLAQQALFEQTGSNAAWHAVGWAGLVPLYLIVGRGLSAHEEDEVIRGHGRTATGWGMALTALAALWSFTDLTSGTASAVSHAILCASSALGAALWRRPKVLYLASLLSLSAATFGFAELGLGLEQMGIGWASLAIGHLILALILGRRPAARAFAPPLVTAGYAAAALSQAPSLFPYDGPLLAYTLGNWIALAAWGARLAHAGRPGFARHIGAAGEREDGPEARLWGPRLLQWGAALPLPAWLWVVFLNRREPDFSFALALATLAWGLVALGHRLARIRGAYRRPWDTVGLLTSAGAPVAAFVVAGEGFAPALCLLATGVLWLCDAAAVRRRPGLLPGGLVIGWGAALLLDRLHVAPAAITFALGALAALYLLAGLWAERRRSALWTARFLAPLYLSAHLLLLATLGRIYFRPLESVVVGTPWGDEVRLWAAAAQVLLGAVYGLYAWGRYRERWAHLAAWLGAAGGGFLFTVYSQGRGSSAFKVAAIAVVFVLAERGLHGLQQARRLGRRRRAFFRLAWRLYRRPCLVTGWIVSAGTIGLALIRNLLILGGGRVQQTWAAAGLLTIVALYALAARLFRRAHFAWFAALLVVAPWTILCNLGWYSAWRPTLPGFAIGWAALAWLLLGLALWIRRAGLRRYPQDREKNSLRGDTARSLGMEYIPRGIAAHARWRAYGRPLRVVAHVLLPFSLLWGVGDVDTGRVTFGLAVAFYGLCAYLDARRFGRDAPDRTRTAGGAARFRYPALALIPVWGVYVLAWLLPDARHEHYGLMFLACGPLGLLAGRRLLPPIRPAPSGAAAEGRLPAYLAAYGALIVGTLLVAHDTALLSLALLFDSVWMVVSARLFRNPLWIYAAAAMAPLALVLALPQAGIDANRHGWWLIGLAAVYLALAWLLRRVRLEAYGTGVLALGFALIALGLPPSSRDQVGAMWGYGGAAALYVLTAIWLRQPLLLTPACALAVVPYAIALRRSALAPAYYGLALLPGAAVALGVGRGLDARLGTRRGFPWFAPARWPAGAAARLLEWWALAPYALGLGLATASPFFTDGRAGLAALNWALVTAVYGWAVARFRLRGWLLAAGAATHLAAYFTLDALGWWAFPADAWLRFLPVTTATTAAALTVERARGEGSPLDLGRALGGWSRPLYLLAGIDVLAAQALSVSLTPAGAWVSMAHAGLLALLASMWRAPALIYAAAALGAGALGEWAGARGWPAIGLPVVFARLALGYGAAGFGLGLARTHRLRPLAPRDPPPWLAAWAKPLRRSSLVLSGGVLVLGAILGQDLAGWTVRALLGMPFREIVDLATVQMAVGVLSLLGLLYVGAAVFYRRERLSYAALGLLLAGWTLYAFYVQRWAGLRRVQWYAMPAGAYLLSVAYMEWRRDNRTVSRWLDYAATLLMIGSLFGQTLRFGWQFAMLLGGEGFAFLWWGSARRLRRFFYVGMVGVILATVGQLINSLQSINQWIVFGIIGLLLIGVAVLLERRMEAIRASLQRVLEDWE